MSAYMKTIYVVFMITIIVFPVTSHAAIIGPEILEKERIENAVDLLYREDFDKAFGIFLELKNKYPDHPAGDFFLGFYYNFLASFYETDRFDSRIVMYYDSAQKKSSFHLQYNSGDPWLNYYMGASMVNRGYLMGKDGNRIAGLKKTHSGISYLEKALAEDADFGDAMMLIGAYRFYRSSLFRWIIDRRMRAVEMMYKSIPLSRFSKFAAKSALGWILIDYGKYSDAENIADTALKTYPDSHLFMFLKARAVFESERYNEAKELYLNIKTKLHSLDVQYSEKDIFNTYYFLAVCSRNLKDDQGAKEYRSKALKSDLTPKERSRLSSRISELEKMRF